MRIERFASAAEALKNAMKNHKTYPIVRHMLRKGEGARLHFHRKANECIIIDKGEFELRFDNGSMRFSLDNQAIMIFFACKEQHGFLAISEVDYLVIRDASDINVYVK